MELIDIEYFVNQRREELIEEYKVFQAKGDLDGMADIAAELYTKFGVTV